MTTVTAAASELAWEVDGRTLAGQCWGDPGNRPLLALHGWLDNSASFQLLAPLLRHHYVVAPDLAGHGRTAHRSADAGYQIWDDLPELHQVLEQLGWQRFALLGHSRGAIIATLLASTLPERASHLVLLDGIAPAPVPEADFVNQLSRFIVDRRRLLGRINRSYPSPAAAVAARQQRGIGAEAARLLATRNLRESADGGVVWTTDPRLHGASAVKLTARQIASVLRALSMPTLLLLAESAHGERADYARELSALLPAGKVEYVRGGHHFHMDGDVPALARRIEAFAGDAVSGNNT